MPSELNYDLWGLKIYLCNQLDGEKKKWKLINETDLDNKNPQAMLQAHSHTNMLTHDNFLKIHMCMTSVQHDAVWWLECSYYIADNWYWIN